MPAVHFCALLSVPILTSILKYRIAADLLVALAPNKLRSVWNGIYPIRSTSAKLPALLFVDQPAAKPSRG